MSNNTKVAIEPIKSAQRREKNRRKSRVVQQPVKHNGCRSNNTSYLFISSVTQKFIGLTRSRRVHLQCNNKTNEQQPTTVQCRNKLCVHNKMQKNRNYFFPLPFFLEINWRGFFLCMHERTSLCKCRELEKITPFFELFYFFPHLEFSISISLQYFTQFATFSVESNDVNDEKSVLPAFELNFY